MEKTPDNPENVTSISVGRIKTADKQRQESTARRERLLKRIVAVREGNAQLGEEMIPKTLRELSSVDVEMASTESTSGWDENIYLLWREQGQDVEWFRERLFSAYRDHERAWTEALGKLMVPVSQLYTEMLSMMPDLTAGYTEEAAQRDFRKALEILGPLRVQIMTARKATNDIPRNKLLGKLRALKHELQ